jgi:hypothetical protein
MNEIIRLHLGNLRSQDREAQNKAYSAMMDATTKPVDWTYEAWDDLLAGLTDPDNHVRAIAAQLLCNLAISDPEGRMLKDLTALLAVTKDERFVTARHCLQALWKVGLAGEAQKQRLVEGLAGRFSECISEKNTTLIRYDIQMGLRNLYDQTGDEWIKETALALIETEDDLKYKKKYLGVWKTKRG